jgi:hypothetical protein
MKGITTLILALAIVLALRAATSAAGPPGGLNVTEQNVDQSGSIRVHEQGTANVNVTNSSLPVTVQNAPAVQDVRVTNSPLGVSGTVDVGNLPLDETGAVRVTVAAAQKGTVFLVAQNFDVPGSGVVFQPMPFIDTSACRSFTAFLSVAGERASSITPQLNLSPDGVEEGGTAGGGILNPPQTAGTAAQFYYLVEGTSTPVVAPFARLNGFFNNTSMSIHVNKAWLYCGP